MSKHSLDAFFNELVKVLFHDVAFYIPSEIFPTHVLESVESQIPPHFLDEISILDIYHGLGIFELSEFNERLIKKPQLFEKNIFLLLEKQKELNAAEFCYILNKYIDKAEFYCAVINWLSINFKNFNNGTIDFGTIGVFEIQNEIYKTHFIELINCFYPEGEYPLKQDYNLSEILKIYLPDLFSRLGNYDQELTIQSTINIPKQNTKVEEKEKVLDGKTESKPKKKLKKEPLITEKEAEDFLLTNVFNIKLNSNAKETTD